MPFDPNRAIVDPEVRALLRLKAWQLWNHFRLPTWDRDDIIDELTAELLRRLRRFVPGRGRLMGFVTRTLDRLAANLCRKLQRERDRMQQFVPLDAEQMDDGGPSHLHSKQDIGIWELIQDVQESIVALPKDLRPLAMLLRTLSKSDAGGLLGVARTSLYPVIRKIRRRFEERGLGGYSE